MITHQLKVDGNAQRADVFVAEMLRITRSASARLIEQGDVTSNGLVIKKKDKLEVGSILLINVPDPVPLQAEAEDISLDIVFEDADMLVVNKPKGMVVHPAPGNYNGTLVNALLFHCGSSLSGINGVMRPGILHRIDKNTSGLLMVAKNDKAHNFLAAQIKDHSFAREYEAIVYGNFRANSGKIDAPIGRHPTKRKQMAVTEINSKNAVTYYEVLERKNGFTHVRFRLETGRTHQIRVHMQYIGHPIVGDEVYGPKEVIRETEGQCLHAKKIGFIHPTTNEYMEFDSELPDYFKNFLSKI